MYVVSGLISSRIARYYNHPRRPRTPSPPSTRALLFHVPRPRSNTLYSAKRVTTNYPEHGPEVCVIYNNIIVCILVQLYIRYYNEVYHYIA